MRRDFLDLVEYARRLLFNVRIKTNAVMIRAREAQRLRALGVEQVQVSVYSHRSEVHDAITRLAGPLKRTIEAIRSPYGDVFPCVQFALPSGNIR